MTTMVTRRTVLAGGALAACAMTVGRPGNAEPDNMEAEFAALEKKAGGRLGVAIHDTGSGRRYAYRGDERFPMCSTFKFLASAAVLARVDLGEEKLDRRIAYTEKDLIDWSPVTKEHVGVGMTIAELCHAAMTMSDNTAGNLLLRSFGGPKGLTAYARSLGDEVTRLDRFEPELNEAKSGDPRDTTTPAAMLANLRKIVLGDALSVASREQIKEWLLANTTGDERLRAGMPEDWKIGDKTGTSTNGVTNDVGVVWPPDRAPIIVSAYLAESPASSDERNVILKEIGRIIATSK